MKQEKCYYTVNCKGGKMMLVHMSSRQRELICKGAKNVGGINFEKYEVLHTTGRGFNLNNAINSHLKDVISSNFAGVTMQVNDITNYSLFHIGNLELRDLKNAILEKLKVEKNTNDLEKVYTQIGVEIRKETRFAQLENIYELVKYFSKLSLSQQNQFIFANTDINN